LKQHNFSKTVYLFGSEGIVSELDLAGIKHIGFGVSLCFISNLLFLISSRNPTYQYDMFVFSNQDDPLPEGWSVDMAKDIADNLNKDVGCVIASLTYEISYMKLMKAVSYLDNPDVIFLGTNTDPVFPVSKGCVLPGKFISILSFVLRQANSIKDT